MFKLISYAILQSLFLASGQVFLKMAMIKMDKFSFTWKFFREAAQNWPFAACGISMLLATLLWLYILKHFDFSVAYPLTSISYLIGMFAAIFVFHEAIPYTRWIGVVLIMVGVFFVTK
jgi:undecaprenyl phosphate-alpha-L-ara4N flippase subunit ArnE